MGLTVTSKNTSAIRLYEQMGFSDRRQFAAYVWDYAEGMELLRYFWEEAVASDARAGTLDERSRFPLCQVPALASLFRASGLALSVR